MVVSNIFLMFTPKIGEDEPIFTSIFFKWVETTNQVFVAWILFQNPFNFQGFLLFCFEVSGFPGIRCFLVGDVNVYVGVSKNTGTPKWMVYNGKPY